MLTRLECQIDYMTTVRLTKLKVLMLILGKSNYEYSFDVLIHTDALKRISTFVSVIKFYSHRKEK